MAENVFAVTQSPPGTRPRVEEVDPLALEAEGRARRLPGGRAVASSGRVIDRTEVVVCGDDGRALDDGEVGEIALRGACLMDGYFGIGADRPALDAAGWCATGDLGYQRDGELFVIGRRKDIIIRAGRNIDPTRLEAAAGEIAGLKPGRAVAFAVPNAAEGTEDIVILAEAEAEGAAPDAGREKRLRAAVVEACQLEAGLAPQAVRILPPGWLLKSSSGKLSRALCREKYLQTLVDEESGQ
jgi:acyl-CoA synthetase (AMP-forming)/AMP-acid ligase II